MASAHHCKVYVVIVVYNGMQWLQRCLISLKHSETPVTVIAIDNGSVDGSQALIKTQFPEVLLIEEPSNLGFGQANNIGIKKALASGADYVFLLNQDAWIEPNTITGLIDIQKNNPEFGIVSPMHLNALHTALDYNFSKYIAPDKCPGLYSDLYINNIKEVYPAAFMNAAAWLLSKECIKKVGLFDPVFFHYGEDDNYCQRVIYHDFKIGICPSLKIVHDRGDRKGTAIKFGSQVRQRQYLIKFCNINLPNIHEAIKVEIHKLIKAIIKDILFLKLSALMEHLSDYRFLSDKKKIIVKSWQNNKQPFRSLTFE
jgi:GT2 family glycosyltransferase